MDYKAIVVKAQNSFYYLSPLDENGTFDVNAPLITAKLRGIFQKTKETVTLGDRVAYLPLEDGTAVIEKLLPRRNLLQRPHIANIDQILIVFAAVEPEPHPLLIDRFLVMAEASELNGAPITIIFNKADLLGGAADETKAIIALYKIRYEKIGYTVKILSAQNNETGDLQDVLADKISVITGPSGVGKSSLLNALDKKLALATGNLSDKIKRGKHTTRLAKLMAINFVNDGNNDASGYIIDTPGFSSLDLTSIESKNLAANFREFRRFLPQCRFNDCLHDKETGCAVKEAVASGKIDAARYESYKSILTDILAAEETNKIKKWKAAKKN